MLHLLSLWAESVWLFSHGPSGLGGVTFVNTAKVSWFHPLFVTYIILLLVVWPSGLRPSGHKGVAFVNTAKVSWLHPICYIYLEMMYQDPL